MIATFNADQFLPRTLESLAMQPGIASQDVEVIIMDGGSTDNTLAVVNSFPFIGRTVSEPDDGIYDAMNKGAKLATGRWLQFLNAGDAFTRPDSLEKAIEALKQADTGRSQWAISAAQNLAGDSGPIRRIPSVPHVWWRHAYGLQPHCHQATWFRRSTFLDSGAHALKYETADDFDVILRFGLLTRPFTTTEVLIDYLGGGISEVTAARRPKLQHKVRVDRFQLSSFGTWVDRKIGDAISVFNIARTVGGRLKSKF
ncbi:glycosyltransferase [Pseudarthrobacter oxydans]|uniref:glycosyltransferase n=1 Tax=Pseudarthrobacter oxydans TaxID=1671 RepID=UPI0038079F2B